MKKRDLTKGIMATMLTIIVAGQACMVPAYAAKPNTLKEEVIYSNLDNNGQVRDITVVNIFKPNGEVVDYGNYSSVRNMTSTDPIKVSGEEINIKTSEQSLYYEGVLDQKELPWSINIKYRLDGKNVTGDELAGKSGHLVITMNISENKKFDQVSKGGKAADFYENMALQASVILDSNKCQNIESENATFANVGNDKQLTYTILPNKGASVRIDTDVKDFEMEGISINGISLNLDIDVDKSKFEEDEQNLKDAGVDLDDGVKELKDGVDDDMRDAVNKLKDASTDLQEAADKLKDGTSDLKDGTGKLKDGVNDLSDGIYQVYNGTLELENGAQTAAGYTPALKTATEDIKKLTLAGAQAAGGGDSTTTAAYISQVNNYYAMLDDYFNGIADLGSGASSLRSGVKELFDATYPLYDGAVELDDGAKEFDEKIVELQDGCNDLKEGVDDLDDGVSDLQDGISELKDGTEELRDKTGDIDVKIDDKVDEMIDEISGTDNVVSFVSTKNTNIKSVQFVIKTAGVEIKEAEKVEKEPEPEKNFWQKLFELFGGIVAHAATTSDEPKDYAIASCWWENDADTITANWDKATDQTKYYVMLYRTLTISSKYSVGNLVETSAGRHDFARTIAQKGPGYYYFVVWPQKLGKAGSITSEGLFVDYEIYKNISDKYGTSTSATAEDKTDKIALAEPQNLYLDKDNKLHWDAVENADTYRIVIFKDDEIAVYKKLSSRVYDLSKFIDEGDMGTTSIRVTALPTYPQYKESRAATIEDLYEFACGWRKIKDDWYYYYDAYEPAEGWYQDIDANWYYFDEKNRMKTGNTEIDGVTYVLNDGSNPEYPLGALVD